jgi:hypothetical protein
MEVLMNDREFSDIEIFQHSGKGIPLFMAGHNNCLQADYLLELCPRLIKRRIYRAAVKQNLRNTGLTSQATSNQPKSKLRAETCSKAPVDIPRRFNHSCLNGVVVISNRHFKL